MAGHTGTGDTLNRRRRELDDNRLHDGRVHGGPAVGASRVARSRSNGWRGATQPLPQPHPPNHSATLPLITTLKLFDVIAVLTGGGPANSTKSVAFYLIDVAFTSNRFGYAS